VQVVSLTAAVSPVQALAAVAVAVVLLAAGGYYLIRMRKKA
jgi:hypothetical protein